MTTIYLVRHGRRTDQAENTHLSDVGIEQAQLTGEYFKNLGEIDQIYASPMIRTTQTAQIISDIIKVPIKFDERLRERIEWGDRSGESYEDFVSLWNKTAVDRQYKAPFGDSSYNTGERVKAVLEEISDNKKAIIVSHGGAIGDFLRNVIEENKLLFSKSLEGYDFLDILECSITELSKSGSKYLLKRFNYTGHLIQTGMH